MASDAMRLDASLADVCFVDRQRGWAVGDRGAIWHTEDGGKHWELQPSGATCRLESAAFLNPPVGGAAGGFSYPYRPIGCPSAMFPAGVFTSETSGRSWDPVVGERPLGPLVGDFLDGRLGALGGCGGPAVVVDRRVVAPEQPPGSIQGLRRTRRLQLTPPNGGWLIGQGGLVLRTADQGVAWHAPPGPMGLLIPSGATDSLNARPSPALADKPPVASMAPSLSIPIDQFDFAALEVRGPKCWIAGNPGTRVFFTPDAGRTWSAFPTGQSLPLAALSIVDDETGFAVGDL